MVRSVLFDVRRFIIMSHDLTPPTVSPPPEWAIPHRHFWDVVDAVTLELPPCIVQDSKRLHWWVSAMADLAYIAPESWPYHFSELGNACVTLIQSKLTEEERRDPDVQSCLDRMSDIIRGKSGPTATSTEPYGGIGADGTPSRAYLQALEWINRFYAFRSCTTTTNTSSCNSNSNSNNPSTTAGGASVADSVLAAPPANTTSSNIDGTSVVIYADPDSSVGGTTTTATATAAATT